jgi:hypothetical protein
MLSRFEKVIEQVSSLSIEIQDEIAEQWLEDIESELNWQKSYKHHKKTNFCWN